MVEPFASTARAVLNARIGPEDSVAIVGPGPIGLMSLMAAVIRGARQVVVVGKSDRRLAIAKQCGASCVIDLRTENPLDRARELTNGDGFDVVVECGGQPDSALLAGRLTRTRGRMVVMGVFDKPAPVDLTDLVFREKTVIGSMSGYGYFDESIAMMTDKRFRGEKLITGRIRLDDLVERGLRALLTERGKHIKIIASPSPQFI